MIQYRPVTFEVEVYRDESGEWVARAVEYDVSATGRTEKEALARVMEALAAHFKKAVR
jgi:predicted RNase H-like HicB family nuclease